MGVLARAGPVSKSHTSYVKTRESDGCTVMMRHRQRSGEGGGKLRLVLAGVVFVLICD